MKRIAFILLLAFSSPLMAQSPFGPKPKPATIIPEEIHEKVEDMPHFMGGPEAMQKYLEENLTSPSVMRGVCSARRLIVGFVVEKDGSLSKIDILKSIEGCPDFDYDVLRVVKNMPKWVPGKLNGRYVRCFYKMPVYVG
jgi:periplasmic protein TonB